MKKVPDLLTPAILLRVEGAAIAVIAIVLYGWWRENWLLFALLVLAPDLAALAYLAGTFIGARVYNLVHTSVFPLALLAYGLIGKNALATALALIWLTHIGADRMLGFGLKYTTEFKDTHLAHV